MIKKSSWHFKIANFAGDFNWKHEVSLCEYTKMFIVGVIFYIILFSGGSGIACLLSAPILYHFINIPTGFTLMGCFLWIAGIFVLIKIYRESGGYENDIVLFGESRTTIAKPSLLRQYINAKKEKFCPILNIEE